MLSVSSLSISKPTMQTKLKAAMETTIIKEGGGGDLKGILKWYFTLTEFNLKLWILDA